MQKVIVDIPNPTQQIFSKFKEVSTKNIIDEVNMKTLIVLIKTFSKIECFLSRLMEFDRTSITYLNSSLHAP